MTTQSFENSRKSRLKRGTEPDSSRDTQTRISRCWSIALNVRYSMKVSARYAARPARELATMRCQECATENPEGARYCQSCGHDLRAPPRSMMQPGWTELFPTIYRLSRIDLTWQTIAGVLIFIAALAIGLSSSLSWGSLTVQVILLIVAFWAIRGQLSMSYWRPSSWRIYLLLRR